MRDAARLRRPATRFHAWHNGCAAGAKLEVQDCTGNNNQAWITGETAAGSGVFLLKNVAAPSLCVDVTGAIAANGVQMQIATCSAASNQLFSAQAQ